MEPHSSRKEFMDQLDDLIDSYDKSESDSSYYSQHDTHSSIPLHIQDEPLPAEELLEILKAVIVRTPKTSNQSFYNQLFGGREDMAVMADMLVARMNNSMCTYKVAGPQVLIRRKRGR